MSNSQINVNVDPYIMFDQIIGMGIVSKYIFKQKFYKSISYYNKSTQFNTNCHRYTSKTTELELKLLVKGTLLPNYALSKEKKIITLCNVLREQ